MKIAAALVLCLVAAPALAFTPERAALMVDAVRANGCSMTGEQAEGLLAPLGLRGDEVQAFVDTLFGGELITLSEDLDTLSLTEALCAAEGEASLALITAAFEAQEAAMGPLLEVWRPGFTPERGAEFVGAVRGAGCVLTEDTAAQVLPPLGIGPEESREVVTVLIDGGLGAVSEDGLTFSLTEDFCAAEAAGDSAALAQILTDWDANHPAPEVHIQSGGDE